MSETVKELRIRLEQLQHAMQSGIKQMEEYDVKATTGKHLRVGVNTAMVGAGALARLLIDKGVMTEVEYFEALVEATEIEVKGYEEYLSKKMNANITLL